MDDFVLAAIFYTAEDTRAKKMKILILVCDILTIVKKNGDATPFFRVHNP